MNKKYIMFFLIAFLHLCISPQSLAWFDSWPKLDTPPGVNKQWIAQYIQHNGVDMQIVQLKGNISATKTLRFYQNLWKKTSAKYKFFSIKDMLVISTIFHQGNSHYQLTLELKAHHTQTQAVLSSMRLNTNEKHPAAELNPHLPFDSTTISDTLSVDLNTLNRTLVAQNNKSLNQNIFHFKQLLTEQGWMMEKSFSKKQHFKNPNKEQLLRFAKAKDALTIHLVAEQGTKIVVVYVRHG